MRYSVVMVAALGVASGAGGVVLGAPAHAGAFTWDPSQAMPALTGGSAAFTADEVQLQNNIRAVHTNNFTTMRQDFVVNQLQPVTGFALAGTPVAVAGFNSDFGLYVHYTPVGWYPINASGVRIGPATYTQLEMELVADVGHDNGSVSVTAAAIGFSNPAGVANDVTLATGHLISAKLDFDAMGGIHPHYRTSFAPAPGEEDFFVAPGGGLTWDELITTLPAAFSVIIVDAVTLINLADGSKGAFAVAEVVPEPASLGVLAAGLLGLGFARGRRQPTDSSGPRSELG